MITDRLDTDRRAALARLPQLWQAGDADTPPVFLPWFAGGPLHGQQHNTNAAVRVVQRFVEPRTIIDPGAGEYLPARRILYRREYWRAGGDARDIAVYVPDEWGPTELRDQAPAAIADILIRQLELGEQSR